MYAFSIPFSQLKSNCLSRKITRRLYISCFGKRIAGMHFCIFHQEVSYSCGHPGYYVVGTVFLGDWIITFSATLMDYNSWHSH